MGKIRRSSNENSKFEISDWVGGDKWPGLEVSLRRGILEKRRMR